MHHHVIGYLIDCLAFKLKANDAKIEAFVNLSLGEVVELVDQPVYIEAASSMSTAPLSVKIFATKNTIVVFQMLEPHLGHEPLDKIPLAGLTPILEGHVI